MKRIKSAIFLEIICLCIFCGVWWQQKGAVGIMTQETESGDDFIKWVDFKVSYEAVVRLIKITKSDCLS